MNASTWMLNDSGELKIEFGRNLNGNAWCAAVLVSWMVALIIFGGWFWHSRWRWWRRRWWPWRRFFNQSLAQRAQLLLHLLNLPVVSQLLQDHPENCVGVHFHGYHGGMKITAMMTMSTTKRHNHKKANDTTTKKTMIQSKKTMIQPWKRQWWRQCWNIKYHIGSSPLIAGFKPAREDIFCIEKPTEESILLQTNQFNVLVSELKKDKVRIMSELIDIMMMTSLELLYVNLVMTKMMMMIMTWLQSEVPTHAGQDCSSTRELLGWRLSWTWLWWWWWGGGWWEL